MFLTLVLFALTLRFGSSEILDCDELLKPVDDHTKVKGQWIILASSSDNERFQEAMNASLFSWFDITERENQTVMMREDNLHGECLSRVAILTVTKDEFVYEFGEGVSQATYICKFIKTNKDSILGFRCDIDLWVLRESIGQFIVLLGRTEHRSDRTKMRFEQMVECAGMSNIYYPPNKDKCEGEQ